MSIARSQLIGKKVYNPDGEFVGEVYDIGFVIGESKISLLVKSKYGSELQVDWDNVAAAKDIIILRESVEIPKPAVTAAPTVTAAPEVVTTQPTPEVEREEERKAGLGRIFPFRRREERKEEGKICPYCGKPATWIPQYNRWYCYNCGRYID